MRNPFEYGDVVGTRAFCNCEKEQRVLRRVIDNAGRLFLYAQRRTGKTLLVQRVLEELSKEKYVAAYVDLWPTESPAAFTEAMAKALAEAASLGAAERMLEVAGTLFSRPRPSVTVDETGAPVLTFGADPPTGSKPELEEVLAAPAKIAREEEGRRVAVVFDEFQQITQYDEGQVEQTLRSEIQHHEDVAYLFLGSRKHLIQEMFLDSKRPLYRSAEHYPLPEIAEKDWRPFIQERFEGAEKTISGERVADVCEWAGRHPFYVQHLCHVLWERCEEGSAVAEEDVEKAVEVLLGRESYAYAALWESLTSNQRRFLRGLAGETPGAAEPCFSS
jgi:AAA+ ATPase superfamily predicted ATPase